MSWSLNNRIYESHLLMGSAGFPNFEKLFAALEISGAQICTVAIRRINLQDNQAAGLVPQLLAKGITLLPNTAGCYTAAEAELTAELAAEALNTKLVKLEVIANPYDLLPHANELLKAAKNLVKKGFLIMPYAPNDPNICQELYELGCIAVMPLGAPIGSGQGILNPQNILEICQRVKVPVIVDAGIGTASHVALAMELGCDAVLVNSAIAKAQNPVQMAEAMKLAIVAGKKAFHAGPIPAKNLATPSSPMEGRI